MEELEKRLRENNVVQNNDLEEKQANIQNALVMAVHKERYELKVISRQDNSDIHVLQMEDERKVRQTIEVSSYGKLKTSIYFEKQMYPFPTVGDVVSFVPNEFGDVTIIKTMERKSVFLRQSMTQGEKDQAIAANFDYVFLVLSLNEDFRISKLERYMALAWQSNAIPVVILTKADLCKDILSYEAIVQQHAPLVDCISVSVQNGYGMDKLKPYLQEGKVIACLGASGVGKSSLINALYGQDILRTNEIRASDDQGHHTTTHRQMLLLPSKAYIIDTPGMRKMLAGVGEEEITNSFFDVIKLISECRFCDCTHTKEPGCAIQQALQDKVLTQKRWEMYQSMQKEEAYAKKREEINKRRLEKMGKQKKYTKSQRSKERDKNEYLF